MDRLTTGCAAAAGGVGLFRKPIDIIYFSIPDPNH